MRIQFAMILASTIGLIGLAGTTASQAMPIVTFHGPAHVTVITPTAGGCGFDRHRGPFGGCRPFYSCPGGWHSGPFGRHCFRA